MPSKEKFRLYSLCFILGYLLLGIAQLALVAQAQTTPTSTPTSANSLGTYYLQNGPQSQIEQYLCAPTPTGAGTWFSTVGYGQTAQQVGASNPASGDLYKCINQIYRFSLILASSIGVFYIVMGGYIYMSADGNKESVDKAKSMLTSTITALVILFSGYILLNALNPDLVQFPQIQPVSVSIQQVQAPTGVLTNTPTVPATGSTKPVQSFPNVTPASGCLPGANTCLVNVNNLTPTHDCSSMSGVCLLSPAAAQSASTFVSIFNSLNSGCTLKLSAAVEGSSGPSVSSCHKTGTCVDFNILPAYSSSCAQAFYTAAQTSGVVTSFQDEYVQAAPSTTGGNIHVNF